MTRKRPQKRACRPRQTSARSPASDPDNDAQLVASVLSAPDESDLTGEEIVAFEILRDAVLKWVTALDMHYVDRKTWQINDHLLRYKRNGKLAGGFSGDFTRLDLLDLREFWLSETPNDLLSVFVTVPNLTPDEWRRRINHATRNRQPRLVPLKPANDDLRVPIRAMQRIGAHPCAPKSTPLVYLTLLRKSVFFSDYSFLTCLADIENASNLGRSVVSESIAILEELHLIHVLRHGRAGMTISLLNA